MGKATRWLRNLLGMKKETKNSKISKESGGCRGRDNSTIWSFAKSKRDTSSFSSTSLPPLSRIPGSETSWLREYIAQTEKEQSKHAIAVATATAAAADAAVAAAQVAVAVVRMTNQGRDCGAGGIERWAAVKIQAAFRGYLARKALRALKGLVKLQAHVRGYIVRRQAAETLQSMEALHRAQAAVRSMARYRRRDDHSNPKFKYRDYINIERSYGELGAGRNDHLMNTSTTNYRLSTSCDHSLYKGSYSQDHKGMDRLTTRSRSIRRSSTAASDNGGSEDQRIYYPAPASSSSPLRWPIPERRNMDNREWGFYYDDDDESLTFTAQSTPRFLNAVMRGNRSVTPPKSSVYGDTLCRLTAGYNMMPNYLSNTQSFQAKSRSQSAPKQRPEAPLMVPRERMPLREIMAERNIRSEVVGCRGGGGHVHIVKRR